MAVYQLTPEEMYTVSKDLKYWHEMELTHRQWCPIVNKGGFTTFENRWYTVVRPGRPIETPDLREARAFIAGLQQGTQKVVFHHMDAELPWSTVEASRAGGFDIKDITMDAIARQLAKMEAYFLYRGASIPSINGLFGLAGNTSADATDWNTAPGAVTVVKALNTLMYTDEYFKPFDLIISENLVDGLDNFINAAPVTDIIQENSIKRLLGGGSLYYEKMEPAAPSLLRVYPFPPPSSEEGVALMVKSDPRNFELLIEQPFTVFMGDFDPRRKAYPLMMFQALSNRVRFVNSIAKNVQVNAT